MAAGHDTGEWFEPPDGQWYRDSGLDAMKRASRPAGDEVEPSDDLVVTSLHTGTFGGVADGVAGGPDAEDTETGGGDGSAGEWSLRDERGAEPEHEPKWALDDEGRAPRDLASAGEPAWALDGIEIDYGEEDPLDAAGPEDEGSGEELAGSGPARLAEADPSARLNAELWGDDAVSCDGERGETDGGRGEAPGEPLDAGGGGPRLDEESSVGHEDPSDVELERAAGHLERGLDDEPWEEDASRDCSDRGERGAERLDGSGAAKENLERDLGAELWDADAAGRGDSEVPVTRARVAPLSSRSMSWLVDGALIGGFTLALIFGATVVAGVGSGAAGPLSDPALLVQALLLAGFVGAAYTMLSVGFFGQTLGGRVAGVRILDGRGKRPDPTVAALRAALAAAGTLMLGVGLVWALVDERGQALHDKLARTFSVDTERR